MTSDLDWAERRRRDMADLADTEFERAVDALLFDADPAQLGDPQNLGAIFGALRCYSAAIADRADGEDLWTHIERLGPITEQGEPWAQQAASAVRSLLMGHPAANHDPREGAS